MRCSAVVNTSLFQRGCFRQRAEMSLYYVNTIEMFPERLDNFTRQANRSLYPWIMKEESWSGSVSKKLPLGGSSFIWRRRSWSVLTASDFWFASSLEILIKTYILTHASHRPPFFWRHSLAAFHAAVQIRAAPALMTQLGQEDMKFPPEDRTKWSSCCWGASAKCPPALRSNIPNLPLNGSDELMSSFFVISLLF